MTASQIADTLGSVTGDRPSVFETGPTMAQMDILDSLGVCPARFTDTPAKDCTTLIYAGYVEHDRRTDLVSLTLAGRSLLAARRRRDTGRAVPPPKYPRLAG